MTGMFHDLLSTYRSRRRRCRVWGTSWGWGWDPPWADHSCADKWRYDWPEQQLGYLPHLTHTGRVEEGKKELSLSFARTDFSTFVLHLHHCLFKIISDNCCWYLAGSLPLMTGVKTAMPAKFGLVTVLSRIKPPTLEGRQERLTAAQPLIIIIIITYTISSRWWDVMHYIYSSTVL